MKNKIPKNKKQYDWDKKNTYIFTIKLNNHTDKDLIEFLKQQKNRQSYIKELIKKDIAIR